MSSATTVVPLATYRNERPYPFCPGCGHGRILDALNGALISLRLDPRQVVLVSDIGCSGLSDQYFVTNAFHGLHGRSLTYASGIKLARPELTVIVLLGDGGTGIGGAHLLAAARRNLGLTALVMNNLNFGMTGGQHSTTTPAGATTSTTPAGHLERPLDICATVAANGASYVFRGTSFEEGLAARIAEAIAAPGFALLDVWEPCTAYYAPANRLTKKALTETMEALGWDRGVLVQRSGTEYTAAYREAVRGAGPRLAPRRLPVRFAAALDRRFHLVAAGAAGAKVRSSARLVARAGILSGLWAAQRDDYPVTVQTGHSVSEVLLSPDPIDFAGGERPDAIVVLAAEGRRKVDRELAAMGTDGQVFTLPDLAPALAGATQAMVHVLDPALAGERPRRGALALAVLTAAVTRLDILPSEALAEAARLEAGERAVAALAAVRAGTEMAAITAGE